MSPDARPSRHRIETVLRGLMLSDGATYDHLLHALTELCHRDTQRARLDMDEGRWERLQILCSLLTRAEQHARRAGL